MDQTRVLQGLNSGAFVVRCRSMSLKRQSAEAANFTASHDARILFKQGDIHFEFIAEVLWIDLLRQSALKLSRVSGQIISADSYFDLMAVSEDGEEWRAENVDLSFEQLKDGAAARFYGSLRSVRASGWQSEPDALEMHFASSDEIDVASFWPAPFDAAGSSFCITRSEAGIIVNCRPPRSLASEFPDCIEEGLSFLFARDLRARAVAGSGQVEFRSCAPSLCQQSLSWPLNTQSVLFREHGWKMFAKFLEYAVTQSDRHRRHDLFRHLSYARAASSGPLQTWGIGVSIAVEGITNLVMDRGGSLDASQKEQRDRLRRIVQSQLDQQPDLQALKDRLLGCCDALFKPRASDELRRLAETGGVYDDDVKAWSRLRNPLVHGEPSRPIDFTLHQIQASLDRVNRVTTLLHQLVFHLISYRGPYTDYGATDFPTSAYPLTSEKRD